MICFPFQVVLTANQRGADPLSTWRYRYAPFHATVTIAARTTGASGNVTSQCTSGGMEVVQRSLVSVGGTAGVQPVPFTTPHISFECAAGDLIQFLFDENAAATPTVDGIVYMDAIG